MTEVSRPSRLAPQENPVSDDRPGTEQVVPVQDVDVMAFVDH